MVTLRSDATAVDGVTLVTAVIGGGDTTRTVRLESRLDGPVWPPRREGRPAAGWDDAGVTVTVPPEGCAVGFASPAPPAEPPLELRPAADSDVGRAADPGAGRAADGEAGPAAVVRDLGDPAPPREAVPVPVSVPADRSKGAGGDGRGSGGEREDDDPSDGARGDDCAANGAATQDPVTAWFERVEGRIGDAQRLADAETVPAATDAVEAIDGLAGAHRLDRHLAADERRLRAVAARATALADRASETDLPLATLERLA